MKRSFRYLRIAFSATCLIACVLLIALWVRSYSTFDYTYGPFIGGKAFSTYSIDGCLSLSVNAPDWFPGANEWKWDSTPPTEMDRQIGQALHSRFHFFISPMGSNVMLPSWFAVAVAAGLSGLPYVAQARRFSLRTLLIATTLVAVVLGLIVWAAR
jgi:hypothetical protein